jgi:1-acyl-sn-glycerol-3-phosphate acyltransferase
MKSILLKTWFFWIQLCTIPVNFIFTLLLKLKIKRPTDLQIKHGTLIIANHQSKIDPFLISYHIGIKNLSKVLPIRYPVTPEYMQKPLTGFVIRLLGGYSIGENSMERLQKLLYTRQLLKSGYTVVIFPEGKIARDQDMIADFQRGVNVLFSENYPTVFVRLVGLNEKHKYRFWENSRAHFEYSHCYDAAVSKETKIAAMMRFYNMDIQEKSIPEPMQENRLVLKV